MGWVKFRNKIGVEFWDRVGFRDRGVSYRAGIGSGSGFGTDVEVRLAFEIVVVVRFGTEVRIEGWIQVSEPIVRFEFRVRVEVGFQYWGGLGLFLGAGGPLRKCASSRPARQLISGLLKE
ncbi:hypothetical protein TIFTF001_014873 [Ficus carica]|uniref:Uncharacterized protein n=1 Tax=Ficus carica TaxID=3494 RepID=A0AA88A3H4_FICCA|nr:hypothetical protein TIFTF001_014873 [Ficus carica]